MVYGHKWVSSYGEADDGTWLTGLSDVTPDQVKLGLEKCRTSDDVWPPTLPGFRSLCLLAYKETSARLYLPDRSPPWSNCTPEVVERELEAMRKACK